MATHVKRSSPSDNTDGAAPMPPMKKQKSGYGGGAVPEPDYSSGVRKKYTTATRTGQACDRCKERKMRCDPNPLGCDPCRQKGIACLVTDRVTGNTGERGEMERLRREISEMKEMLSVYQQKHGMEIGNGYNGQQGHANGVYNQSPEGVQAQQISLLANYAAAPTQEVPLLGNIEIDDGPCAGPVRGSKVSMFGFEIDTARFASADLDEPAQPLGKHDRLYNKSKTSVLRTAMGGQRPPDMPPLPTQATANSYVGWYFMVVNPYVPVLHEPTFKALLAKFFDDPNFNPTPAEYATVYMVFAIFTYQLAVRSPKDPEQHALSSNLFFHFALGFYPELVKNQDLPSLQALTLICIHIRNFPKSSFSWLFCQSVYSMTIDLNMHRSAEKVSPATPRNFLEHEMYKRIFWVVLTLLINVGAKMGRPMPLSMHDIDVELPILAQDSEITPDGLLEPLSGNCIFRVGIHTFRIVPTVIEMYNNIINVRRSAPAYVDIVNRLEKKFTDWVEQWKNDIAKMDSRNSRVFTIYVESWACEYRLMMHHPDVCTSSSPEVQQRNFDICHQSSKLLLSNVQELYAKFVGLDFSSQNLAVYVLAAATTIYFHLQRKESITQTTYDTLDHEMKSWLQVMASAGKHLGCGDQLYSDLKRLVDHGMGELRNILLAASALENGGYPSVAGTTSNVATAADVYGNGVYSDRSSVQASVTPQQQQQQAPPPQQHHQQPPQQHSYAPQEQQTAYQPDTTYQTTLSYHNADPQQQTYAPQPQAQAHYAHQHHQQQHQHPHHQHSHSHSHSHSHTHHSPQQDAAAVQQAYIQTAQPWGTTVNVSGYHPATSNHTATALLSLAGTTGADGSVIDTTGLGMVWPNTMIPGHGI